MPGVPAAAVSASTCWIRPFAQTSRPTGHASRRAATTAATTANRRRRPCGRPGVTAVAVPSRGGGTRSPAPPAPEYPGVPGEPARAVVGPAPVLVPVPGAPGPEDRGPAGRCAGATGRLCPEAAG